MTTSSAPRSSAALTIASAGAEVRRVAGDAARAEATVAGWPAAEVAAFFGLEPAEADAFYEVFGPIATGLGLRYGWRREGDAITLAFDQDDAG